MRLQAQATLIKTCFVSLFVSVVAISFAQPEPEAGHSSTNVQDQTSVKRLALSNHPSLINLQSILEHQEALELECARFHDYKIKELERLIKFNEENENIHLPSPVPVKVPAVCLFLFGATFASSNKMLSGDSEGNNEQGNGRVDVVNWIFNEEEIQHRLANATVKREQPDEDTEMNEILHEFLYKQPQVVPQSSNEIPDSTADNNNFVDNSLKYDFPSHNNINNNKQDEETNKQLHENIEKMLSSQEFKQMIDRNREKIGQKLSPVILIPGLLGSRLQAKVDKVKKVNIFCSKQSDWQDMWLSLRRLLPLAQDCWLDNVRLEYNSETGFTKQPPGVETRVPDFGSVESVRYLDVNQPKLTKYMAPLIERYEQLGYTIGKNLLAAPYDFRLAPQELEETFFKDLKTLIEQANSGGHSNGWFNIANSMDNSNRKKVTLVCHSMGCTHVLIFLRKQSAAWRQSRIQKLIALSSPWGGSIKSLKALVVGDQLDLPLLSELKMRKLARTYPSIAYLMPQAQVFNRPNMFQAEPSSPKPLVETPSKIYTVNDLADLLRDLQMFKQLKWFNESALLIKPFEPLADLYVDCIHSLNTPTPETIIFKNQTDFPNGDYDLIQGEGDGTVNFESLMVCADWAAKLPDKVTHKIIMNTNHIGVLSHKAILTHLTDEAYIK